MISFTDYYWGPQYLKFTLEIYLVASRIFDSNWTANCTYRLISPGSAQ